MARILTAAAAATVAVALGACGVNHVDTSTATASTTTTVQPTPEYPGSPADGGSVPTTVTPRTATDPEPGPDVVGWVTEHRDAMRVVLGARQTVTAALLGDSPAAVTEACGGLAEAARAHGSPPPGTDPDLDARWTEGLRHYIDFGTRCAAKDPTESGAELQTSLTAGDRALSDLAAEFYQQVSGER